MKHRYVALAIATATTLALGFGATTAHAAGAVVKDAASGITPQELAQQLIGDGTVISNIALTGTDTQIGAYTGFSDLTTGGVDASAGVVLSTGYAGTSTGGSSGVLGPNIDNSTSTGLNTPGDADLDALLAAGTAAGATPLTTEDAASLEFDFVAKTDALRFSYVFGSEEYLEYVDSSYNDIFGLFVNGVNCATIGSANDAVSINTVNPNVNADSYRDNPAGTTSSPSPINVGFDGLTTVLTCQVAVTKGEVNHVKFAIGDVSDGGYDSGVFIVGGSFITDNPEPKDDTATTPAGKPVTIPVLANDDGEGLTLATDPSQPLHGTATLQGDQIVYTPAKGYSGPDTFDYTVTGKANATATATVTITVTPTANSDTATTAQGEPVTIDVGANDTGSELTITAVAAPGHAKATINADGTVTYTPAAGYSGVDEFTYTAMDSADQTATATVTVTVVAPPAAVDDPTPTVAPAPVDPAPVAPTGGTVTGSPNAPVTGWVLLMIGAAASIMAISATRLIRR
ncbi:MAG: choice-of-anchor L domain-containing protein [Propionibacteriaceae bacterium]|jgi:hypothetical protein|nr:choice-of-anchor L domain-containing protein [Propionibacteriaceae bacterium]